ncbi:ThiF family adenylyltransferase [Candidatus Woesearchaeota archaeon]|nr:ThiF family adenylyltransferase [Candidatus Woesearchaeota archaeon]
MRYIRQEIFNEIGKEAQKKLGKSCVAIVGLGALGSVSIGLLARAGVGKLVLVDRDIIELSNLQRQNLFTEKDIGKPKAYCAKKHLSNINSDITIDFFVDDLNFDNINKIFSARKNFDLILDCTDNLETRFLINDFSIKNDIPFIYASVIGSKGYIFNVISRHNPCLRCFLKPAKHIDTCETIGVLNTISNMIASFQVNEAIKILLKRDYEKKLLFFDIWKNELMKITVNKNKNCICCANAIFEYLNGKKTSRVVRLCGDGVFQIKNKELNKKQFTIIKNKLKKIGKIVDFEYCINFDNKLTFFQDGRALIKAKDEKEAKSIYAKFIGN